MNKKTQKGFTLIELLVVVAILAILALIVLLALNPVEMQRRTRDSRRLSDLGTLRRAIDLALADGDKGSLTSFDGLIDTNIDVTNFPYNPGSTSEGLDISAYLSVVPQDPVNDGSGNSVQIVNSDCTSSLVANTTLNYNFWSDGDVYVIKTRLESKENCDVINNDGRQDDYYQIGTDPGLDETSAPVATPTPVP